MESTFIWIVIFAGAAIALLAVFLVASERELKKKRQEVDELGAKLGEQPAEVAAPTMAMAMPAVDSEKLDALQAKTRQLENELATAMSKLELSRRTIEELQDDQRRSEATQSNAQWLQTSNDQLKSEIEDLKQRALTSEARINESAPHNQDASESQRQLEAQVATLQQQLTANQSKLREFDSIEQKLANAESIETSHRDARRGLETRSPIWNKSYRHARKNCVSWTHCGSGWPKPKIASTRCARKIGATATRSLVGNNGVTKRKRADGASPNCVSLSTRCSPSKQLWKSASANSKASYWRSLKSCPIRPNIRARPAPMINREVQTPR